MRLSSLSRLAALAALVTTVACGGDSGTGPSPVTNADSFSGTVSGDFTRTLSGVAAAGHQQDPDLGQVYGIAMSDGAVEDTASGAIILSHVGAGLAQKAYDVGDLFSTDGDASQFGDKFFGLYVPSSKAGINDMFYTTGGTITISSANASRVKGSFDVTMKSIGFDGEAATAPKSIRVKGSFDAPVGTLNSAVTSRASTRITSVTKVRALAR